MAEKKEQFKSFTTPKGEALWPHLTKPDTKFDPNGDFRVRLLLNPDDKGVKELISEIDTLVDQTYDEALEGMSPKDRKLKGDKLTKSYPHQPHYDEEGNETGLLVFNLKRKHKVTKKDGTVLTFRVGIFDGKGKPIKNPRFTIGNGSILKANGQFVPFYNAATNQAGVSLRLMNVQIIDLVEYGGGTPSGFGDEGDDGWAYNAEDYSDGNFGNTSEGEASNGDF